MTPTDDNAPAHRSRWRRFSPSMGWKAFWSEILIVVLGVVIALAANEAVEDRNWRSKVADGQVRLKGDTDRIFVRSAEHYATQSCVDAQLDRLARNVVDSGSTLAPAPTYSDSTVGTSARFVLRMPTRPWTLPAWEALVANGTATHFSQQWQDRYAVLNDGAGQIREHRMEANRLIGRLMALSYPSPLDAGTRRDYLVDIETLRRLNFSTINTGSQMMARMLRDGMAPKPDAVDAYFKDSGTVRFCKQHGLPLADWREVKPAQPGQ
ncbi:MAG TPA: hypothetical protein VN205_05220 [Thermomonas sp.]|nr:hypothetical protein [Thermomonas sp.]